MTSFSIHAHLLSGVHLVHASSTLDLWHHLDSVTVYCTHLFLVVLPNLYIHFRTRQCSPAELYKFGWTLYVYVKGHFPHVNGDLVNSHHLLLCCMDMFYANAVVHDRQDLLNPQFPCNVWGMFRLFDIDINCLCISVTKRDEERWDIWAAWGTAMCHGVFVWEIQW